MGVFRPHLVLPLAIIFLANKRLQVVFGVACSAIAMAGVSIAVVGWREFLDYPGYIWRLEQIMGRGSIVPNDMPNLRGFFAIFLRDGHPAALALTAIGSVLLMILAIRLFRRAEQAGNIDLAFSVAVLATILVSYHAFIYDPALLFLPALFLIAQARPGRERLELLVPVATLFFTPLLMFLFLRLSRLNLLTPILFLWLWAMCRGVWHREPGPGP